MNTINLNFQLILTRTAYVPRNETFRKIYNGFIAI